MTERLSPRPGSPRRTARRSARQSRRSRVGDLPPPPPAYLPDDDGPGDDDSTILGFPADFGDDLDDDGRSATDTAPVDLVVHRRPDRVGCALLVLAGVAANVSLSLAWLPGPGTSGLSLVSHGIDQLSDGIDALVRSSLWQPVVVVAGGGVLVLLGLGVLVPARAHRLLGVLALLVALATAAAVLVLLASSGWRVDRFSAGTWFAAAVPVLGLLGALKAMLTPPHVVIPAG
jgi:hypothetical protein